MTSRKSFEMQFNWIFILIIGAAIILFFSSFIFRQKNLSDAESRVTLLGDVSSLIDGASVSIDTTIPIKFSNSKIGVSCNKISVEGTSKQYQNLILFAPSSIQGKAFAQALTFSLPYRAANMLFITSQQMKYILIGSGDLFSQINRTLPAEITKENYSSYDASKIKDDKNYKVRLILINAPFSESSPFPASLAKMADADVTALKIDGDAEKGNIKFYQKKNSGWILKGSSIYIGKSSLMGAVYTDSEEIYSCSMKNAFSRAKIVTTVYSDRAGKIAGSTSLSPQCRQAYSSALPKLRIIYDSAGNLAAASSFDISNADKIITASHDLSTQNKQAQKFSCPLIY